MQVLIRYLADRHGSFDLRRFYSDKLPQGSGSWNRKRQLCPVQRRFHLLRIYTVGHIKNQRTGIGSLNHKTGSIASCREAAEECIRIIYFQLPLHLKAEIVQVYILMSGRAVSYINLHSLTFISSPSSCAIQFPCYFVFIRRNRHRTGDYRISIDIHRDRSVAPGDKRQGSFSLVIRNTRNRYREITR